MGIPLARLPFTAAVGMVDRVHDDSAHVRTAPEPAAPARLADGDILMVEITDLADRRHARGEDASHFAGLQPHLHIIAVPAHDLGKPAGATDELATLAGLQFNIMNRGSQRHVCQRQRIASVHLGVRTGLQYIADL